jgi:two-component system, OmpR family, response regulator
MRILYVDDEPDLREIASIAFSLEGDIVLETAEDGPKALEMLNSGAPLPDVILLDMMMPGMSGLELLQKFEESPDLTRIPVIFVTARAQKEEIKAFKEAGAIGVIAKPYDPMSLATEVRRLI